MTKAEILAIIARADNTTQGDWERDPDNPGCLHVDQGDGWARVLQAYNTGAEPNGANLEFLKHARMDVLKLADECLRLHGSISEIAEAHRVYSDLRDRVTHAVFHTEDPTSQTAATLTALLEEKRSTEIVRAELLDTLLGFFDDAA